METCVFKSVSLEIIFIAMIPTSVWKYSNSNILICTVYLGGESSDQATAESYWSAGHVQNLPEDDVSPYVAPEDFFPSTHGLVQTHPATFNGFGSTPFKLFLL